MFVNFDHERARAAFARFEAACAAIGIQRRHNVTLEFRGVDVTDPVALRSTLAKGLDSKPIAVIAPNSPVLMETVRLTEKTPVIFFTHQDPVDLRLAPSLVDKPYNIAGISFHLGIEAKILELLREAAPQARRIGYVLDKREVKNPRVMEFMRQTSSQYGIEWKLVGVETVATLATDLRAAGAVDAWFVTKAVLIEEHPEMFVAVMGATNRPAIYPSRREVAAGGTISYEAVFDDPFGSLARQLDRVLSGVAPNDIPIERPKRFNLSINIKAARAMGMRLSAELLARADRVL
jgi:putative ABC transport system substrate-binding protein